MKHCLNCGAPIEPTDDGHWTHDSGERRCWLFAEPEGTEQ